MKPTFACLVALCLLPAAPRSFAAESVTVSPPVHTRIAPAYPVPYEPASAVQIKADLDRILGYLEKASPIQVIDRDTQQPVPDAASFPPHTALGPSTFLLTTYEWGVTYSGMLHAAAVTGDSRYREYAARRLTTIARLAGHLAAQPIPKEITPRERMQQIVQVRRPQSLDDSGAMAAAMIRASRDGIDPAGLRPCVERYLAWIRTGQYRLADGTLARHRPLPDTLWLDDLYMSVPALAQMAALTGDAAYFDDAVKQVLQFSARMFVPETKLYRHGWVQAMQPHPAFHWARANGWAALAMTELLELLPPDHPGRGPVLAQYHALIEGLAACQGTDGLWHQLLDRPDTYLETSASAMFVYAMARGIDRGWLDASAYGPATNLGWNAVARKINAEGQVEGTCVGTGMGFDPMFYSYRPTSVLAAHGYGPVLLAGAEMIRLQEGVHRGVLNDQSVQFLPNPPAPAGKLP